MILIYKLIEIAVNSKGNKIQREHKLFDTLKECMEFREGILRFQKDIWLEIEETKEENKKKYMDFIDRIKESADIKNEIKLLRSNNLQSSVIEKRLFQLSEILIKNKIYDLN